MRIRLSLVCGVSVLCAATSGAQGSIVGTVYDSLRAHGPLANATVVLVERARYATADSHGNFQIDDVPDGRYSLGFSGAVLDSFDVELPVITVVVASGRRTRVTLATPSMATMYARLCPASVEANSGAIVGRVRDVDDNAPLAHATVGTDWTEFVLTGGHANGHRVRAATQTDSRGVYLLCGVPTQTVLEVRTQRGGASAGPIPVTLEDRLVHRLDVALSLRDTAAGMTSLSATDAPHNDAVVAGTASLHGVVIGADGRPVRGAIVVIVGTLDSSRTDVGGSFDLAHIRAGTRAVQVRSIGLLPTTHAIDFPTNGTRGDTLSVGRKSQVLAPVDIEGRARSATSWMELSGFESRRAHGLGAYLTETDIAKHDYPDLAAVLAQVRGVHMSYGRNGKGMPFLLGIMDLHQEFCIPNVFLDGAPYPVDDGPPGLTQKANPNKFADLSSFARPGLIRGIEVYSSPGSIPAEFDRTSSTGCGSIVIWTH